MNREKPRRNAKAKALKVMRAGRIPWNAPVKACRKKSYPSYEIALHIVLRRHTPYPIRIYKCPACAGFHLTKRRTWEDKTA